MTLSNQNINKLKTILAPDFDVIERNRLREERMASRGVSRAIERREKDNVSNTNAGYEKAQGTIESVQKALESFVEETKPVSEGGLKKGGAKPLWLLPITEQLSEESAKVALNKTVGITPHQSADMAVRIALDAGTKKWSYNQAIILMGKMFACLVFEYKITKEQSDKRLVYKQITNLHDYVVHKTRDYERRADIIWRKAKEKGFSWDDWQANDEQLLKHVGAILINAVLRGSDLIEIILDTEEGDAHPTNYIVLTDATEKLLAERNDIFDALTPMFGAMLVPPNDWGLDSIGAYNSPKLAAMTPLVKNMPKEQKSVLDSQIRQGKMEKPLRAINSLQRVPLVINDYVLDAVLWARKQPELHRSLKKFPKLDSSFIQPVERLPKAEFEKLKPEEQMERKQEIREVRKLRDEIKANLKNFATMEAEAKELLDEDRFYLPHQFDTRGRIYHATDFGHHNADYIRSLFLFADYAPVGESIWWIAIAGANTFGNGYDKKSLDAREDWFNEHKNEIYAAGNNYETSFDFWSQADEPFQFLAVCREFWRYVNFVEEEGGNPEEFMSNLPIALDATQSGVQHYAAAIRSEADGKLVNLYPCDEPQDFYTACLAQAKQLMKQDLDDNLAWMKINPITEEEKATIAQFDNDIAQEGLTKEEKDEIRAEFRETSAFQKFNKQRKIKAAHDALSWNGYNRSVIKRNCMTYCYNSRQYGFAEQIRTDTMKNLSFKVRDPNDPIKVHPFGKDKGYYAAFYLGSIHERAIEKVISSASVGMNFIKRIAEMLASENKHLTFITPLGFPMHQHYEKSKTKSTRVFLFDRETEMMKSHDAYHRKNLGRVDKRKSGNAVCPNVIHAMDATHLMMTVLACLEKQVSNLLVVHDSFACRIGDVDIMRDAVRESFYELYKDFSLYDSLQMNLYHAVNDNIATELPAIPKKGNLDLSKILEADYPFS